MDIIKPYNDLSFFPPLENPGSKKEQSFPQIVHIYSINKKYVKPDQVCLKYLFYIAFPFLFKVSKRYC